MAPGKETKFGRLRRGIVAPIRKVHLFLERTLNVRFCYENSIHTVARAYGLISFPFSFVCGCVAMFFGTFHMVQGALSVSASGVTFVLELPLMPDMCKTVRKYPLRRAFLYFIGPPMLDDEEYLSNSYEMKQGSEDEEDGYSEDDYDNEYEGYNYYLAEGKENYDKRVIREIQILYKDEEDDENYTEEDDSDEMSDGKDEVYASNSHVKPLNTVETNF